jgi:hypothetical protein
MCIALLYQFASHTKEFLPRFLTFRPNGDRNEIYSQPGDRNETMKKLT